MSREFALIYLVARIAGAPRVLPLAPRTRDIPGGGASAINIQASAGGLPHHSGARPAAADSPRNRAPSLRQVHILRGLYVRMLRGLYVRAQPFRLPDTKSRRTHARCPICATLFLSRSEHSNLLHVADVQTRLYASVYAQHAHTTITAHALDQCASSQELAPTTPTSGT